jgi:DNA-binding NtrC family response regulator
MRVKQSHDRTMSVSDAPQHRPGGASSDAQRPSDPLLGRRVLIVEDDPYITLALEETLIDFGLLVAGSARNVPQALRLAQTAIFDVALLDVNIGEDRIDPVADAISARGIPFIFTTGCGRAGLPEAYLHQAIVEKPFYVEEMLRTLRDELTAPRNGDASPLSEGSR